MNETFDPMTLIMIAAAVVVFFKLRSVLGQKTGHQKPLDPFQKPTDRQQTSEKSKTERSDDNVIQMPDTKRQDTVEEAPAQETSPAFKDFSDEIQHINKVDASFHPAGFIDGAKAAYEMIVTAFAEGNKKTLKTLLSKEVFGGFSGAIDDRKKQKVEMTTQFIGIDAADIKNIELEGSKALITVRFVSELVSWVKDKSGSVVEGNESEVQEITDIWTFERNLSTNDPNWRLVATDDDEG